MTYKENYLRAIEFKTPDYIPMCFHINDSCYDHYDNDFLFELMEKHSLLFPDFKRVKDFKPNYANCAKKDEPYLDDFSCLWKTSVDGITGTVVEHPIDDWSKFSTYKAPNPEKCMGIGKIDWNVVEKSIKDTPDILHKGGLRHGHTFLQLCDIRGYENLMFDMIDEEPMLWELIELIENFNTYIIKKYVEFNVDIMGYAEDLGMNTGPMISPNHFKKYIKPVYQRMIKHAKDANIKIHMHSDGDIRTLVDDIIDSGVDVINLQDMVNGIDWIADRFKDNTCVELDIDRQNITVFGGKSDIDNLIKEAVTKIGSKKGGLMMIYGLYPGVPEKNISYLMDAMEKHMLYY